MISLNRHSTFRWLQDRISLIGHPSLGIYGSRAWKVLGESREQQIRLQPNGRLDDKHADFRFEPGDYRFTAGNDGSVYIWTLCPPQAGEEFVVRSLGRDAGLMETPPQRVIRLGSDEPLDWRQDDAGLHIHAPQTHGGDEIQGYCVSFK